MLSKGSALLRVLLATGQGAECSMSHALKTFFVGNSDYDYLCKWEWASVVAVFNFLNVPLDVTRVRSKKVKKVKALKWSEWATVLYWKGYIYVWFVQLFFNTKATKASIKIAKRGKTCFPSFAKKSYGGQRMAQRSLIKEYEPRRKIYWVFCFIDSVTCPARGRDCKSALFVVPDARWSGTSGNNGKSRRFEP